ncbi:hypothetical protein OH77DRAFT_1431978 [Trametes cingulata]|nr:hypothetical protein OH77DRAFT_1431978 [Trametes cingulata]
MSEATATTSFSHPFTKSSADVILRTPDGVEFRVHKLILSEASPVFGDMFTLPQPELGLVDASSASPSVTTEAPKLPVVDVTETSQTLDHLLRLCYPMDDPMLALSEIAPVIRAARKYDMKWATDRAGRMLVQDRALNDPKDALRVFAVASDLDVPQAEEAAKASLRGPLGSSLPYELDGVSPASLYRLLEYRRRVHVAVMRYLTDPVGWAFKRDFGIEPRDWGLSDNFGSDAILLPFWLCRGDHLDDDNVYWYPGEPSHVRIDQINVIGALVEQVQHIHEAFNISTPIRLRDEAFQLVGDCEKCRMEAVSFLDDFFRCLRDAVEEVIAEVEVPLDEEDDS